MVAQLVTAHNDDSRCRNAGWAEHGLNGAVLSDLIVREIANRRCAKQRHSAPSSRRSLSATRKRHRAVSSCSTAPNRYKKEFILFWGDVEY